ncbi:hypothetical protein [Pseudomonas sp. PDM11]|uniref:hypothetical protein n=1 Tax=Pseudomonas sp. PDM11 TaxID=2769309 RepID=UPI00177ACB92|nr:hypothetical protein [Pseudomonas sp. PDM11]MBD9398155.1 hypothetical protein [Pseudomonas sp. PDM11]
MLKGVLVFLAFIGVGDACSSTGAEYSKDNAVISVRASGDSVAFNINSSVDMHACEISEAATMIDDSRAVYTSNDPEDKCTVLLTLTGDALNVTTQFCESYCGVGAIGSMDGSYKNSSYKAVSANIAAGGGSSGNLPMADINAEAAELIQSNWDARQPAFQSEISLLSQSDPDRGVALVRYLNIAFSESGYSLDKTFNVWSQKALGPGAVMYPELHRFGVHFGFVDILAYLTEMGPAGFSRIQSSGVFSESTMKIYENMNLKRKK